MCNSTIIAVTGSSGFLGNHILNILKEEGLEVLEIDLKRGVNILSYEYLGKIPAFRSMIHLAAKTFVPESYSDSLGFYQTNILGTLNCLELCKKYKADIIFTSSYVYGKPKYLPVDENHPTSFWNPYATSKLIGEQLCASYSRDFGVNAVILRIFNIFGPGQNFRFLIPAIINGVLDGDLILQSSYPKRDFVYVLDVVEAVLLCLKAQLKGVNIYNIGSGISYSVKDVVNIVQEVLKTDVNVRYENSQRKSEIKDVVADISKIKRDLNWFPKFDLTSGLKHYIDSVLKQKKLN